MYAIHPADAVLGARGGHLPNVSGLRPGALVDIGRRQPREPGRPAVGVLDRVGFGRVSADGRTISADGGSAFRPRRLPGDVAMNARRALASRT